MIFVRVDAYRLEVEHDGHEYSIETFVSPKKVSTHVRRDGVLVKYCQSEQEALDYLKQNLEETPK